MEELITKLNTKTATIGIVGLGYVGLPLILRFAEEGYPAIGFDIDTKKIEALDKEQSYIKHIDSAEIVRAKKTGMQATTDFSRIADVDAIIMCVPTPLDGKSEPDLSYVLGTMDVIAPYLRKGQVLSLESTTYPGTTEEEILPYIKKRGFKAGEDIALVYSPEREDPGNADFTTRTIPKVVGGYTPACLDAGCALYGQIIDTIVPVSTLRVAEMSKLLENIHRAVNIGLVNEMKIVADKMGIDIFEVIKAAASKPFGFVPYYPGPGIGGHCIPIDPFYLTWKAKEFGVHTRFIELAGEINRAMPDWVIGKLVYALNERGKAIKGAKILLLGIAYKKNVDDLRESPCLELLQKIIKLGADADYADPYISAIPPLRKYNFEKQAINLTAETLQTYDAVVLGTDHDAFDYDLIKKHASLIVDTRGKYHDFEADGTGADIISA